MYRDTGNTLRLVLPTSRAVVTGTVHERGLLGAEARSHDKRSRDVFWKGVFDVVVGDVVVLQNKRQVRRRYRADTLIRLAAEHLLVVVGRGDGPNHVTSDGSCLRLDSLTPRFGRLLEGGHPLTLPLVIANSVAIW